MANLDNIDTAKIDERIEIHGRQIFVTKDEYNKDQISLTEILTILKNDTKENGRKLNGIYKWCGVIGTAAIGGLVTYVLQSILR